jgi:pentatricopeptide repeat protein
MAGYSEHGYGEKALDCVAKMRASNCPFSEVTLVCGLKACGGVGALIKGKEIHVDVARKGLEQEHLIGNALIDFYSKLGLPTTAEKVFDKLQVRDLVSWNAQMAAFSQTGNTEKVLVCFYQLLTEGLEPDMVTFSIILNAYSHAGLQNDTLIFFCTIVRNYSFLPSLEHYTCMVDLLGRAGRLDEAAMVASKMPMQPETLMWRSILGSCQKWYSTELGRQAFKHAQQLNEDDAGVHVCMSNMYSGFDLR